MATPKEYAIREVGLVTFYSLVTGKAIVQLQNLSNTDIENSASLVWARGNFSIAV